jgi:hypothetical protein
MDPVITSLMLKAGNDTAEVLKKQSESFLTAALGEPAKALGGLLADTINARRHRNLVVATVNAKQRLTEAGVSPKEVPLSIIHPALEAASLEENPDLQSVWANLLANAADPRQVSAVLPSFTGMLGELTVRDAKFLAALHSHAAARAELPGMSQDVFDIAFSHSDLLKAYANAGLSRKANLADISVQYWRDHTADLKADLREFSVTLNTRCASGF